MRTRHPSVPHRLGRRTSFIPPLEGRAANWAEVMDVAEERTIRASVAAAATATLVTLTADEEPVVATAGVDSLSSLVPDQLLPVRRPASHQGMTNYISKVVVPSQAHDARAVWCESFNELTHLRDLLLTRQPTQVATQPLRLEWVMPSGIRSHVPDFLLRGADGGMLLVDVTTKTKLDDPRLKAILGLTTSQIAALTTTQLRAFSTTDITEFTTTQIGALSATQVGTLSSTNFSTLDSSQIVPRLETIRLPGLMSRWISPLSCAVARPSAV